VRRPFPFVKFFGIGSGFVLRKWEIESRTLRDYKTARNGGKPWVGTDGIDGCELTDRLSASTI
jgi:hypothetical protein